MKSPVIWAYAPEWAKYHTFDEPQMPDDKSGVWWEVRPTRSIGNFYWSVAPNNPKSRFEPSGLVLPDTMEWRLSLELRPDVVRPAVVVLCGSTRFSEAFQRANLEETLAGKIVLTIGCDMRSDKELFKGMAPEELAALKERLDELHLRKIDLADEVLILNCGGYVGTSTARELQYAKDQGKLIRYLEIHEKET